MPIVFSAVACDRDMVAKFASCDGNFTEIAEQVLSKLPPCNNKMTYSHGVYLLHYIAEDDYLYFCITDKLCQRSRAFLFLNEIQRRFIANQKTNEDFTTILAAEMYRYSEDYSTIVIRKGELDELNNIGVGCSESILGEKILYINNPDIISYSTISHVKATPGLISVSGVCPTSEEISVASQASKRISVMSPERTSNKTQSLEKTSVIPTLIGGCAETRSEESISHVNLMPEDTVIRLSPKRILSASPGKESSESPQQLVTPSLTDEAKTVMDSESHRISPASPNNDNTPITSPRLYIIIIGMIILVIAMSVYALGPISCVVVTSIGIYSLLRSYSATKHKSE